MNKTKRIAQLVGIVLEFMGSFFFIGLGFWNIFKNSYLIGGTICIVFGLLILILVGFVTAQLGRARFNLM